MPFNPTYFTQSVLELGEVGSEIDFAAEISGFQLVPTYTTTQWKGLKSTSVFQKSGAGVWALTINFAQDHESAESLSRFLHDNETIQMPYRVEPNEDGTAYSGELICQAGPIGGDVDTFGNATVTLPVLGKPLPIPA